MYADDANPNWLNESQALFSAIWDTATEAIAVSDPSGRVLLANPAYYSLYGWTPKEVIGHSFALIFPPDQREAAEGAYGAVFNGETPDGSVETIVQRADGTRLTVEARWHFLSEGGRRVALVSLVLDVTARKRLEESQRELVAMIIHDLRTPLTTIMGYAQLLERQAGTSAAIVSTIVERCRVMQRLIQDLADTALSESRRMILQPSEEDLGELVRRVTEEMQMLTPGRQFRVEISPGSRVGHWDRIRLEQVIENLLSNAVKYSSEGSDITVRVETQGGEVRVSVQDQGKGIPPDSLTAIFDRFYRLNQHDATVPGWGLGLFISKQLVEAHGGRIWAESAGPGFGSTVFFSLPLASEPARGE